MIASIAALQDDVIRIGDYRLNDYLTLVEKFHGSVAPGMVMGGFMVDFAIYNLPKGEFFDAICETKSCLPDAIQLLTPCTTGNGWMRVMNFSRYALGLFEKTTGEGVRVYLDPQKILDWPEVYNWFYKLKPKKEQNHTALVQEIIDAGYSLFSLQKINLKPEMLTKNAHSDKIINCSCCGEPIRSSMGNVCPACRGEDPYLYL